MRTTVQSENRGLVGNRLNYLQTAFRFKFTGKLVIGFAGISYLVLYFYATYTNDDTPQVPEKLESTLLLSEIADRYQQIRVDCSAIFAGDVNETKRAVTIARLLAVSEIPTRYNTKSLRALRRANKTYVNAVQTDLQKWSWEFKNIPIQWYLNATKDCAWFRWTRGYIITPLTREEAEFPVAFSLMVYKDLEMVERLLRSVYRPQNFYCIHVDGKSGHMFYQGVQAIASCFPGNVRVARRRVRVFWGHFSVLEPELVCMEDLWKMDRDEPVSFDNAKFPAENRRNGQNTRRKKWKYLINLTGQEFPLKTNYELVKILKAFKGANSQEGTRR
ncbi:beta-1,3-galactosyl-O-glycosyl-glycoprotein beta-1,6-N-acetylglucosaminyltransferase 3-like [Elysia marginata]|uniref:Beta-1,3-galactosyl-O-glycosyl-glycoprotein beta-1,6-N-acetylglucosaminyltransferase 3-like n=1 Tax=Elysia marginata TaxID=1093978 RepID=A0AAV4ER42_9GAST|nr:beta-1,3-galactosyl-O-glycosyl-glycoprotein beta-1,6-N-acetylglucosaminyltransferase 3-like [Elysia marginata]